MRDRLVEIVKRAAYSCLPSNTEDFHLDRFVTDLLANGVTVQEWISANEPPKENCKQVLIALSWDDTDIGWYDKEDKCWRSEYVNCYDVGEVTHWQYLPQPPKGE